MFSSILAIVMFIIWVFTGFTNLRGLQLLRELPAAQKSPSSQRSPRVSVIVAAKEEEDSITSTVKHLLNQDYESLELIVVNDRSQDQTGVKLEQLKNWAAEKKGITIPLKVIHITSLPKGWLGKNHALFQGYKQARGEYILFTDADVVFQPETIRTAIDYMTANNVEHLTLAPHMRARGFWLKAFVRYFLFSFQLWLRPWRANLDHQNKFGMGIGAFNLISKQGYRKLGTHESFPLRPEDDVYLGIKAKQAGLKQRFMLGHRYLSVHWYPDLQSGIKGLEKNTFAGLQYSLMTVFIAVFGQILFFFFPFMAFWLFQGEASVIFALTAVVILAIYLTHVRKLTGEIGYEAVAFPITVLLFVYVLIRSTYLTLKQGGIYWRGTFYSLKEMKKMNKNR